MDERNGYQYKPRESQPEKTPARDAILEIAGFDDVVLDFGETPNTSMALQLGSGEAMFSVSEWAAFVAMVEDADAQLTAEGWKS